MRVLIVDDDPDVLELLRGTLEAAGHHCKIARTLAEGHEELEAAPYDAVVADSGLPDGDGVNLAGEAAARGLRTFIVTGMLTAMKELDGKNIRYFRKPFSVPLLLAALETPLKPH